MWTPNGGWIRTRGDPPTAGDARLARELGDGDNDVVAIGGRINGQNPGVPPDEQSTVWFERVLNIIHKASPSARIALVRSPDEHVSAVERVLAISD